MKINNPLDLPDSQDIWYVYVLLCDNGSYYKGLSHNLRKRYIQHSNGKGAQHTKKHKPIAVVYYEECLSEKEAVQREKYMKSGSGREWLKKLIEGGEALP
jgi:type I restriction enzyme S subunit